MRRLLSIVTHNWPLKVAAVVLATMLYTGFVLSQSVQEFPGPIPITPTNQPPSAKLVEALPPVTNIQYFSVSDPGARASTGSFRATVDLSDVDPASGPAFVPVKVESVDPRFQASQWEPREVRVTLDPIKRRNGIAVKVVPNPTPSGLDVREPVITPETVSVTGPASVVDQVVRVEAHVTIEPNGLDIDDDVDLIPVDAVGDRLTPVDVDPTTAHVQIAVFKQTESRPLPVTPVVSGAPSSGYEIAGIAVDPQIVSVEGDADAIVGLAEAPTEPVSIAGATLSVEQEVALALPEGVQPAGGADSTVRVTVTIRPIVTTRSYDAAIVPSSNQAGLDYRLSTNHAIAAVSGALADLDRLDAAQFVLLAPVGGLGPGTHEVTLTANLPIGLTLVSATPASVVVTVTVLGGPSPSASP
ncbi:MAG: YbbR-like domain-containing protein [Chloroflexota bacterium]